MDEMWILWGLALLGAGTIALFPDLGMWRWILCPGAVAVPAVGATIGAMIVAVVTTIAVVVVMLWIADLSKT